MELECWEITGMLRVSSIFLSHERTETKRYEDLVLVAQLLMGKDENPALLQRVWWCWVQGGSRIELDT